MYEPFYVYRKGNSYEMADQASVLESRSRFGGIIFLFNRGWC
jgi:hypothetical protein